MAHIFKEKARAQVFASGKNALVRKGRWVVEKGKHGGWVAWHKETPTQQLVQ